LSFCRVHLFICFTPDISSDHQTHTEYLRRGTIESGHLRDVENAERKAFNDKVDSILQKKKYVLLSKPRRRLHER
jgi:hypothetical protein